MTFAFPLSQSSNESEIKNVTDCTLKVLVIHIGVCYQGLCPSTR